MIASLFLFLSADSPVIMRSCKLVKIGCPILPKIQFELYVEKPTKETHFENPIHYLAYFCVIIILYVFLKNSLFKMPYIYFTLFHG